MTMTDLLRRAQTNILSLQAYIAQLEPKATAFDLLVRTHLGRTAQPMSRDIVNELEAEIVNLQLSAAADAEAAAAKEAAKKAKAKQPRKPRTPKTPPTGEQQKDEPPANNTQGSLGTSGTEAPTPIEAGRRRRGIFGGAPAAE